MENREIEDYIVVRGDVTNEHFDYNYSKRTDFEKKVFELMKSGYEPVSGFSAKGETFGIFQALVKYKK
jgi:hypothetical protein